MADYTVVDPTGRERVITGPDGATDEQIIAQAKRLFSPQAAPAAPTPTGPPPARNAASGVAVGLGEAALEAGTGLVGTVAGGLAGLYRGVTGSDTPGDTVRGVQNAMTYRPRTELGQVASKTISLPFEKYSEILHGAGNLVRGTGGSDVRDRFGTALEIAGEAAPVLLGGAQALKNAPRTPSIPTPFKGVSPELQGSAAVLKKNGVDLLPHQVAPSQGLEYFSSLPGSGASPRLAKQGDQLSLAVARRMGEETSNLGHAVTSAKARLSGEFDQVLKLTDVQMTKGALDDLIGVDSRAQSVLSTEQYAGIGRQVKTILEKVDETGALPSSVAYEVKKRLDTLGKSNDSGVRNAAREVREVMAEALNASLGPEAAAKFATTRMQYGTMSEVAKRLPAGSAPQLSPTKLAAGKNAFRDPEMKRLADAAADFLKPTKAGALPIHHSPIQSAVIGFGARAIGAQAAMNSQWLTNMRLGRPKVRSPLDDLLPNAAPETGGLLNYR